MKRKIAILTALMAVLPLLQGCQTKTRQHTFFAMDAVCSVQLPDTKQSQELLSRAEALVRKIEDEYSKIKESGLPQKLTAAGGIITLDDEQAAFFAQILSVCEMTDGALTAAPSCRNLRSCDLTRASTSTGLKGFVM